MIQGPELSHPKHNHVIVAPTMEEESTQIAVRMSGTLHSQILAFREDERRRVPGVTKAQVIRILIQRGLDASAGPKPGRKAKN